MTEDSEVVAVVPRLRLPPSEMLLERIGALYGILNRPLTDTEVLWLLDIEGSA